MSRISLSLSILLLAPALGLAQAVVEEPRWVPLEPEPEAPTAPVMPRPAPAESAETPSVEWAIRPAPDEIATPAAAPETPAASIPYVSGGVGASEREELAQVKSQYNLQLLFAVTPSGVYLSNVQVLIQDAAGATLLDTVSRGPLLYARLAPGDYRLTVTSASQAQTRQVRIPDTGASAQAFYWPAEQIPGM